MDKQKHPKRIKDKSDRSTRSKVLDLKTRKILSKLTDAGKLKELTGCISAGKEANVYTALASQNLSSKFIRNSNEDDTDNIADKDGSDVFIPAAIKIYQTSIMEFKSRERYIDGDTRFERFCRSNPRKLIKLWAEKEVRNMKRLNKANIPSPVPLYLKRNVLIMSLICETNNQIDVEIEEKKDEEVKMIIANTDNNLINQNKIVFKDIESIYNYSASPRLKDAIIDNYADCYDQILQIIYKMYKDANLVHADLSEYNLLVNNNKIIVIDVGQSVEATHENAMNFLITDITNITRWFSSKNVQTKSVKEVFEWVTGRKVPVCIGDNELKSGIFIASCLDEVVNEEDAEAFLKDKGENNKIEELIDKTKKISLIRTREEKKEFLKVNKKKVKEENRVRKASKISKKEKEKLQKRARLKKKQSKNLSRSSNS